MPRLPYPPSQPLQSSTSARGSALIGACACAAIVALAPPARAAGCRPAVTLQGPADLTLSLARTLRDRGVGGAPDPACPELRARVDRDGRRVAVTIIELSSPRSQRDFDNEELAAAFIESWTRSDISAPLLDGLGPATLPPPPLVAPAPASPPPPRLILWGGGSVAIASDRSLWAGGVALACARVSAVCLGGLLSLRARVSPSGPAALSPQPLPPPPTPQTFGVAGRVDYAALLLVQVPLRTRYVTLIPGAGLGAGWWANQLSAAVSDGAASPNRDQVSGRARVEARAAFPLRLGLAIDLGLSADFAFGGTGELPAVQAQPGMLGPSGMTPPVVGLPALSAPWGTFGLNLGVSWSGVSS